MGLNYARPRLRRRYHRRSSRLDADISQVSIYYISRFGDGLRLALESNRLPKHDSSQLAPRRIRLARRGRLHH